MKSNRIFSLVVFAIVVSFFTACEYEFVEPKQPVPIVPSGDTVSFSKHIVPIWNNGNNCTSCHGSGGSGGLNLLPEDAYNSIISNGLVDQAKPTNSKIYYYAYPTSSGHSYKKYSQVEADAVLLWIKDGSKNN
jgi:hypothetical protein